MYMQAINHLNDAAPCMHTDRVWMMDDWQLVITWGDECFCSQEWCSLTFHLYFFGLQDGIGLRSEKMTTNKRSGVKLLQNKETNVQYIKKQARIIWGLQEYLWWAIWWEICFFFSFTALSFIISEVMEASCSGRLSGVLIASSLRQFEQTIRHTQQDEFWTIKMRRFKLPESDLHCESNIGENPTVITWTMQGWNSASSSFSCYRQLWPRCWSGPPVISRDLQGSMIWSSLFMPWGKIWLDCCNSPEERYSP